MSLYPAEKHYQQLLQLQDGKKQKIVEKKMEIEEYFVKYDNKLSGCVALKLRFPDGHVESLSEFLDHEETNLMIGTLKRFIDEIVILKMKELSINAGLK